MKQSYERESLIRRSTPLERAANQKLFERRSRGDNWTRSWDSELIGELNAEVEEIRELLHERPTRSDPEFNAFQEELLRECGDVINYLRFIADKYGCLDDLPSPDPVTGNLQSTRMKGNRAISEAEQELADLTKLLVNQRVVEVGQKMRQKDTGKTLMWLGNRWEEVAYD